MNNKIFNFVLLLLIHSCLVIPASAEEPPSMNILNFATINNLSPKLVSKALENPETINKVLDLALSSDSRWKFLKDLNVKFKTFKSNNGDEAFGFSYDFSKDINKRLFVNDNANQAGICFSVNLEGNVAFDKKTNPNDFLNSNASLHLFRSQGGVVKVSEDVTDSLNELILKLSDIENKDDLFKSPLFKTFSETMRKYMSTQSYIDFSVIGGIESNQAFTEKQYYYGGQLV